MKIFFKFLIFLLALNGFSAFSKENEAFISLFLDDSPISTSQIAFDKENSFKEIQFENEEIPYTVIAGKIKSGLSLSINGEVVSVDANQNFSAKLRLNKSEDICAVAVTEENNKTATFHFSYSWKDEENLPFLRLKTRDNGKIKVHLKKADKSLSVEKWITLSWKESKYIEEEKLSRWYEHARLGFMYAFTKAGGSSASLLAGWSPKWQRTETLSIRAALLGSVLRYDQNNLLYLVDLRLLGGYTLQGKYLFETGVGVQNWHNYGSLSQSLHFSVSYLLGKRLVNIAPTLHWLRWLELAALENSMTWHNSTINYQLGLSIGVRF